MLCRRDGVLAIGKLLRIGLAQGRVLPSEQHDKNGLGAYWVRHLTTRFIRSFRRVSIALTFGLLGSFAQAACPVSGTNELCTPVQISDWTYRTSYCPWPECYQEATSPDPLFAWLAQMQFVQQYPACSVSIGAAQLSSESVVYQTWDGQAKQSTATNRVYGASLSASGMDHGAFCSDLLYNARFGTFNPHPMWWLVEAVRSISCPAGYEKKDFPNNSGIACAKCPKGTQMVNGMCVTVVPIVKPKGGCDGKVGNPIDLNIGTKTEVVRTGIFVGRHELTLTYDSLHRLPVPYPFDDVTVPALALNGVPAFGALWYSNFHRKLFLAPAQRAVTASRGNGVLVAFTGDGSGNFSPPSGYSDRLASAPGGYYYLDAAQGVLESYDTTGRLLRITGADGRVLTFAYSDTSTPVTIAPQADLLLSVADDGGRTLNFEYEAAPDGTARVKRIVNSAGLEIIPAYDGSGNLTELKWEDLSRKRFVYDAPNLTWALTGVIDERDKRFSIFAYDSLGRAISTERAGGTNRYSATFTHPPYLRYTDSLDATNFILYRTFVVDESVPINPTVTLPTGQSVAMVTTQVNGQPRIASRSQPAGSGCAASIRYSSYDDQGNLNDTVDYTGARVCRSFAAGRNLETVRIDGQLTIDNSCQGLLEGWGTWLSGLRKTSSEWHPDWELRTRVAEPKKLTTTVYNGQPDPFAGGVTASCVPAGVSLPDGKPLAVACKRVEQATTDVDGRLGLAATIDPSVPARTSSYTYDGAGRLLTATDARGNVMTYTYFNDSTADHAVGDLASVRNAANHVTNFTQYNAHGQLLRSVDPNGVVTAYAYDARRRLTSMTVGPESTSYAYDLAGNQIQVVLPDGTTIQYEYDDAHRLTKITDGAGNTVNYTLDNSGNKTAETWKDPGGSLARSITRAYDALNRLQSVTGAAQ